MEDAMRLISFAMASLLGLGNFLFVQPMQAAPGDALLVTGDNVNLRSGPSTATAVKMRVRRQQLVVEVERHADWARVEIVGSGGDEGWIHGSLLARPDGQRLASPIAQAATAPKLEESQAPIRPPAEEPVHPPAQRAERAYKGQAVTPAIKAERLPAAKPELSEVFQGQEVVPAIPETHAGNLAKPAVVEPTAAPTMVDPSRIERFRNSVEYLNGRALEFAGVSVFTDVRPSVGGAVEVGATDAWETLSPALQASYLNTLLDRWAAVRGDGGQVALRIVDSTGRVIVEHRKP
jgi:Bacterial SH3 domain